MHNLTKYLCCNKLGGETLHILFIVYTVQAPSGSLLMYLCRRCASSIQSYTLSWQHTCTQTTCISLCKQYRQACRANAPDQALFGHHEVSIFLTKHHSQRLLAGKVPSKCRELPCMCVCVPACSSQLQQCQVKAEFKCIAAQR